MEVVDAAHTLGDGNRLVFPMRSGGPIATSTLPEMLQSSPSDRGRGARVVVAQVHRDGPLKRGGDRVAEFFERPFEPRNETRPP